MILVRIKIGMCCVQKDETSLPSELVGTNHTVLCSINSCV